MYTCKVREGSLLLIGTERWGGERRITQTMRCAFVGAKEREAVSLYIILCVYTCEYERGEVGFCGGDIRIGLGGRGNDGAGYV